MSLETQVAELIDLETKNLTKYTEEYDERTAFIEEKGKEVDNFIAGAVNSQTGMKNYYLDPFGLDYTEVKGKKIPNTGFRPPYGSMTIECVSPYYKGAMAIGENNNPQSIYPNSTTDFTVATEEKPYYNGYGTGKVFYRGGLKSSWGGNASNGYIFKITSPKATSGTTCWLGIEDSATRKQFVQVGGLVKIRLRTWIYVEKGKVGFGSNSGYEGKMRGTVYEASKEWQLVDISFAYGFGNPLFRGINIGTDSETDLEMYMVAPCITVETASSNGLGYIA